MTTVSWPLYRGTKELKAKPMTKAEYCGLRGWRVPEDEDPNERGYVVEYQDGGKPNLDGYEGYVSWSPADVFERTYFAVYLANEDSQPHIARMEAERFELNNRLCKLSDFIHGDGNPTFAGLPAMKQNLLKAQRDAMQTYLTILSTRLSLEKED